MGQGWFADVGIVKNWNRLSMPTTPMNSNNSSDLLLQRKERGLQSSDSHLCENRLRCCKHHISSSRVDVFSYFGGSVRYLYYQIDAMRHTLEHDRALRCKAPYFCPLKKDSSLAETPTEHMRTTKGQYTRVPTSIGAAPWVISVKRQLDLALQELFAGVPCFPIPLSSPLPMYAILFNITPVYAIPPLTHCHT